MLTAMTRLAGKVAIIAGGAGGIGSATSLRVASEGAAVVVADLNLAEAERVAGLIRDRGGNAVACPLDLGDAVSISGLFDYAADRFGGVDLLHCNGATTGQATQDLDVLETSVEAWEHTLRINLTGYFLCTKFAIPRMLERSGGSIVYTSSGAAFFSDTTRIGYSVAKTGIHGLMRHVALRWGKEGIRANAIAPGLVLTPAAAEIPQVALDAILDRSSSTRLGKAEDIAAMVAMLFSPDGEWINGQAIGIDGGYYMR